MVSMAAGKSDATNSAAGLSRFATTRWSVVLAAGRQSSTDADQALAALCQTYWYPLYAYVRRRVLDVNEAQDLTQSFFAKLLQKNYVSPATPERGRFRSYLLTSFKHFLSHEWEKAKAEKRGGGRVPISLDFDAGDSRIRLEPCTGLTADELYERQWAVALLGRVMELLEAEFAEDGKAEQFVLLKDFLVGDHDGTTYDNVAAKLGTTAAAAKMAASRMRRRYRKLLRDEIAQTVAGPDEVDEEIRDLFKTLGSR
jgi:DNA-directed RNA polymerase specialized sigma24 family protein